MNLCITDLRDGLSLVSSQFLVVMALPKGRITIREFQVKGELDFLSKKVKALRIELEQYAIKHILWEENWDADELEKLANLGSGPLSSSMLVTTLPNPSFEEVNVVVTSNGEDTWMILIIKYLSEGVSLESRNEARKVLRKAPCFTI